MAFGKRKLPLDSILEDVRWIQSGLTEGDPWEGSVRKTSDYFDLIYDCGVALIQQGNVYVDSCLRKK